MKRFWIRSFIIHAALFLAFFLVTKNYLKREVVSLEIAQQFKKAAPTHVQVMKDENANSKPQEIETLSNESVGATSGSVPSEYLSLIVKQVNQAKRYPQQARVNEQEGEVVLRVGVAGDGAILDVQFEKKAVHEILNQAAMDTIRAIGRFPSPPGNNALHLMIPIYYQLQ